MTDQEAKELLQRYENNLCTPEEKVLVESWYLNLSASAEDMKGEPDYVFWNKYINEKLPTKKEVSPAHKLVRRFAVAASIIFCLGIGAYFYQSYKKQHQGVDIVQDIAPGRNTAMLTLAGGKQIVLSDLAIGSKTEAGEMTIEKTEDGTIRYHKKAETSDDRSTAFNTITTPKGGQYQVILPDGTKVWLNAASSLKFPSSFSRLVNRSVELLRGEAYFEVAKDKIHPFIVKSSGQEVEVLGTHFNVNCYSDESFTKTTLLEGSVRLTIVDKDGTKEKPTVLRPNEQAQLTGKTIKVTSADTEEAIAWKNGYFKFNDESIESVMRKVARWYNIKVQYSGPKPTQGLEGSMSREQNLTAVLKMLQATGLVKFEVNGNTIIVSK